MPPLRSWVRALLLAVGVALLWQALRMDAAWFQRHVAGPALFLPPPAWMHGALRAVPALAGLSLVLGAAALSRLRGSDFARSLAACLLACGLVEVWLHRGQSGVSPWRTRKLELKMGRSDPRYGWILSPSSTVRLAAPGAPEVTYAIDGWGNRSADARGAPDPSLPSLVVAGESIAVGHGLPFEETFAARVASALRLQIVNVAAGGYGTDQALLRLEDALHRLSRPVAVVMVVPLLQLERNVQDYRPRLALSNGTLRLVPPADGFFARLRLRDLFVNELPVLGEEKLRRAVEVTAAELREAASVSRAAGAQPLFLVPAVGPERTFEAHPEAELLRPLFVDPGLPFLLVDLDRRELLPYDGHPNAAASERVASLLARNLRPRLAR